MKITDDRKEGVFFRDIDVAGMLEDPREEGAIYMKLNPIIIPGAVDDDTYNAVNVGTGDYARFFDNERIIPVYGSFHREGHIND